MTSRILSCIPVLFSRRSLLAFAAITALAAGISLAGAANAEIPFTTAALGAAQNAGKPILVHITAPWCPTCRAQKPILSDLFKQDQFKAFVVLDVDFDSQKDAVRDLNAQSQSTLIVYKGKAEVGRSVGDTNAGSIEALLAKAL